MKKIRKKTKKFILNLSKLEDKHKIITYASLLFLSISTYFLRTENQNFKIEFASLKERNIALKQNMIIFNRNYEVFPLPVWQKVKRGNRFIIQYVNPKYVEKLGHLFKYDYNAHIGKDNFDLFEKKLAQEYYEKDLAVAITGDRLHSIDEIFDTEGKQAFVEVVKWRQITKDKDTLVYGMVKKFIKNNKE
jgi:hypothetical protein